MLSIDELKQLEVGDTVFIFTNSKRGFGWNHTVEKIGRKYIYLDQQEIIDLTTGKTKKDYRGISLNVWKDEAAYQEDLRKHRYIRKIKSAVEETKLSYDQALKIDVVLRGE